METATNQRDRATTDVILSMVENRPYSIQQITHSFNARSYDVIKLIADMVRSGQVMVKSTNEGLFIVSTNRLNH